MFRTMTILCGLQALVAFACVGDQSAAAERISAERDGAAEHQPAFSSTETSPEAADSAPGRVAAELPLEMKTLRDKVHLCLGQYYRQPGHVARLTPWELMHASLAFGVDTQVIASGEKVNALGWLCWNGSGNGRRLLAAPGGALRVNGGLGVEGHDGQFLSILAQSKVRIDSPFKVGGYDFTVADLVASEQSTCRGGTELTFKLIGLVHYLDSDATWHSDDGATWSIQRLIKEELAQPIVGAACGGTHRMTGLSYAVRRRARRGESFTGEWKRAKQYVDAYHEYAFKLQNADGSFSTDWFAGRGDWGDAARRLNTSGHTLEWLVGSLPADQLRDPRVIKSVAYLADLLMEHQGNRWEMGALGHALHALTLYDERAFGSVPGSRSDMLQAEVELAGAGR